MTLRWLAVSETQIPGHGGPLGLDDPAMPVWLDAREEARLARYRFTKRRTEYRLRRLAGKHAVAAWLDLPTDPASLCRIGVLNRMSGAPYVEIDGQDAGFEVSLTDRAGAAVALLDRREPGAGPSPVLGVDLELVEPRTAAFVADYFTAAERKWIAAYDEPDVAANLLWSATESALKVYRLGLRADTRWVEITIPADAEGADGWRPLTAAWVGPAFDDRFTGAFGVPSTQLTGWWRRDGRFLLTLAADRPIEPPRHLDGGIDLAKARPIHSWLADPLPRG